MRGVLPTACTLKRRKPDVISGFRLYPDSPRHRFTVSPVSGCVGVTDVSLRPGAVDSGAPEGPTSGQGTEPGAELEPELETGSERDPDPLASHPSAPGEESGSGAGRGWQLEELPFEVLQHIAGLLDPYR